MIINLEIAFVNYNGIPYLKDWKHPNKTLLVETVATNSKEYVPDWNKPMNINT